MSFSFCTLLAGCCARLGIRCDDRCTVLDIGSERVREGCPGARLRGQQSMVESWMGEWEDGLPSPSPSSFGAGGGGSLTAG